MDLILCLITGGGLNAFSCDITKPNYIYSIPRFGEVISYEFENVTLDFVVRFVTHDFIKNQIRVAAYRNE